MKVSDLTLRERRVYEAIRPSINANLRFSPEAVANAIGMTRSLFNCYLTRIWRAKLIVRIERGRYVWPDDPRAVGAPEPTQPVKRETTKPGRTAHQAPATVPGVTYAMLTGGRAPRRSHRHE